MAVGYSLKDAQHFCINIVELGEIQEQEYDTLRPAQGMADLFEAIKALGTRAPDQT